MENIFNIVWFKRDLRVSDHLPLFTASKDTIPFIPLYILEEEYWKQKFSSFRHWSFVHDCLVELDNDLSLLGQSLIIKKGHSVDIFNNILNNYKIKKVFAHEETSNLWVKNRNTQVKNWCLTNSIELIEYPTNGVVKHLKSRDDWSKVKNKRLQEEIIATPKKIKKIKNFQSEKISKNSIVFKDKSIIKVQAGGRKNAIRLLDNFLNKNGKLYLQNISSPKHSEKYSSRISPHLTWGSISSKEIIKKIRIRKENLKIEEKSKWQRNLTAFQSRLSWRCHFIQKIEDDPLIEISNMHALYENIRDDGNNNLFFKAWKNGKTGYPFVDACMRNLTYEGWITFRMRAMLVSFASYDLWLDWRFFGHHLAKLFTDYEPGIHYSQLQMQSGVTGINTLRIYNPIKQSKEHDKSGEYIKKWVPELKNLTSQWIHEPWKMSQEIQIRLNCEIGKDYSYPIVDHNDAVRIAKQKISKVQKQKEFKNIAKKVYLKHGSRSNGNRSIFNDRSLKIKKGSKQLSLF